MSRSGYSDELDQWDLIRWRGAVASALRGRRGQAFLQEMLAALDALPNQRLIIGEIQDASGDVCALGSVSLSRGIDPNDIDIENNEDVAEVFGIAKAMVCEIEYMNDESHLIETPENLFCRMRSWVVGNIREDQ